MRRVAVFAHYDPHGSIRRYVVHHLRALREVSDEIHFLSTARLDAGELAKLDGMVTSHRLCENVGFDFRMWANAIRSLDVPACDELLLTNSSIVGPTASLAPLFRRMEGLACDFWGMTDSEQFEYHLQSFFLVFRKAVLTSGAVEEFFGSVLPYRHKLQVIRSYELGLTHFFLDRGFAPAVVASVLDPALRIGDCNPCLRAAPALLALGMPYVKVELLRDNPFALRLDPVLARMAASAYPMELVEELVGSGRRPRESSLWDFANRVDLSLRRWGIHGRSPAPLRREIAAGGRGSRPGGAP